MPENVNVFPVASATNVTDGGATETVVLTVPNIDTTNNQGRVLITGIIAITPGTSATAITVKIRRGTTTAGVEVGTADSQTGSATAPRIIPFHVEDQPGEVAGQSYVITVTETSATADGTVSVVTASVVTHG